MMKNKFALLIVSLLMIATSCQSSSLSSSETDPLRSYSDEIKDISFVSTVTGADSKSRTDEMTVGGCDLGFPLYNESNDTMYLGFGDSFTSPLQSGRWRSNTVALSTDENFADGLDIDSFLSSP